MNTQTPKILMAFRIIFGFLLIGAIGLNLWLSWLATRTTSVAIGLALLLMMMSVCALVAGAVLLFLESSHLKESHHHTPSQGMALTGTAVVAAVSAIAAIAATYQHFITDASQGFFTAAVNFPPATALWCLALLSLAVWVVLMAVVARSSTATSNTYHPERTRT